jgi:hypothetical protein
MRVRLSLAVLVVLLFAAPPAHGLKQPLGPDFIISDPSTTAAGSAAAAADTDTGNRTVAKRTLRARR